MIRLLLAAPLLAALALQPFDGLAQVPRTSRPSVVTATSIRSASPAEVRLVPGSRAATVNLVGVRLDLLSGAVVVSRGRGGTRTRPANDIRAALGSNTRSGRQVRITAGARAASGTYDLLLTRTDPRTRVRSTIVAPLKIVILRTTRIAPVTRPTASTKPSVRSASTREVRVYPAGRSAEVTLDGVGLDRLSSAVVTSRGRTALDVRASLGRMTSRTARLVQISAGARAVPGTYQLQLTGFGQRGTRVTVPTPVQVIVVRPRRPAARPTPTPAPTPAPSPAPSPAPPPPPALTGLTLSSSRLDPGVTAVATITLDRPAPSGGTIVHMASDDPAVTLAETALIVPPTQTRRTVLIQAHDVTETKAVTLTATLNDRTRTATVTVEAPPPPEPVVRLGTASPASVTIEPGTPVDVTLAGRGLSQVSDVRFEHAGAPAVGIRGTWIPQSDLFARLRLDADPGTPPGTDYTAVAKGPDAEVEIPVAIEVVAVPETPHLIEVRPDAMIFTQTPTESPGSVRINKPAPEGGMVIALETSRPDLVTVPSEVTIPAGETSAAFTVGIAGITSSTPGVRTGTCGLCVMGIEVTADDGATTMSGTFTANGNENPIVTSLELPSSVTGGATFPAQVKLSDPTPKALQIDVLSDGPGHADPITIDAGQASAFIEIQTDVVSEPTALTLEARAEDALRGVTGTVQVLPVVTAIQRVQLANENVWMISSPDLVLFIGLTTRAPIDRWVRLESSDPRLAVPDSVKIQAESLGREFGFDLAASPDQSFPVTITARAGETSASAQATVYPYPKVASVTLEGGPEATVTGPAEVSGTVELTNIGPFDVAPRISIRTETGTTSTRATLLEAPVIPAGGTQGSFRISVPAGATDELLVRATDFSSSSSAEARLHVEETP